MKLYIFKLSLALKNKDWYQGIKKKIFRYDFKVMYEYVFELKSSQKSQKEKQVI